MVAAPWYLPLSSPDDRLFARCMYCGRGFAHSVLFSRVPPGTSFAYDPLTGRIWSICGRCRRWNLIPLNERFEAVEELERHLRDRGRCVAATANIALYHSDDLELIRIGAALPVERAAWRYGRQLTARAAANQRPHRRIALLTAGAVARAGESIGAWKLDGDWGPSGIVDVLRWQRFGIVAWNGRSHCSYCGSVLHTLHFDSSWWLYPRFVQDELVVGVPCTRCDPWTPKHVFDVTGDDAHLLLRRALAYQHVSGADERTVEDATQLIRAAGSPETLLRGMSSGRSSLWRLGPLQTLALEMSANHLAERRALETWLAGVEAEWRAEEELARIVDRDLS
jgi:hypothetical protein